MRNSGRPNQRLSMPSSWPSKCASACSLVCRRTPDRNSRNRHFVVNSTMRARSVVRSGSFRDFCLLERFGGSFPKHRTGIEVGNVGDVPSICFAVEDVAMVVLHGYSPASNSSALVLSPGVIVSLHCQHRRSLKGPSLEFLQRAVCFLKRKTDGMWLDRNRRCFA